jgi:hypothetical protein
MPKVQAWERVNDPEYCGRLTMGELYDLMIRAGYSEEVAQEAAKKRGWDRLMAEVPM